MKWKLDWLTRGMAAALCLCVLGAAAGCRKDQDDSQPGSSAAASQAEESADPSLQGTYYDTDVWEAVPMITQELKDAGYGGGEGCQWPLSITFDAQDGKLAFFGTDVGGIYRSKDSGKNWEPCTIGFTASGATGIAIDPNNNNRVLAVGCNAVANSANGLYLSTDMGDTWKGVCNQNIVGYRDFRDQIVWDKSSYDEKLGGSKVAYWSREKAESYNSNKGATIHPVIYKTEDGGETWTELAGTEQYAGYNLGIHPSKGYLYVATDKGVYKSTDGGKTFKQTLNKPTKGIATTAAKPDNVYILADDGLYTSTNAGDSFSGPVKGSGFPDINPMFLEVSPVYANYMTAQANALDAGNGHWPDQQYIVYSHDGGKTWNKGSKGENGRVVPGSPVPYNVRQSVFAWHPKDKNTVMTFGGDWIMKSTDGGKNYKWSNAGYVGIMTGGHMGMNVNNNNWIFIGSQDYNGFHSLDGGKTWIYTPWLHDYAGFVYGGYVLNENTIIAGVSEGWESPREICVSFDGGKTRENTGNIVTGAQLATGLYGDDKTVFFGEWVTRDGAKTWTKMDGCDGVFCQSKDGTLFGRSSYYVVKSTDKGKTWERMVTTGSVPNDMAYDDEHGYLYIADGALHRVDMNQKEPQRQAVNTNGQGASTVAVDSRNPNIIYVGAPGNTVQNDRSVGRSTDGGKTWVNLTRTPGDGRKGPDGGNEATTVRVNTKTGELIVTTGCRGVWKMKVPDVK